MGIARCTARSCTGARGLGCVRVTAVRASAPPRYRRQSTICPPVSKRRGSPAWAKAEGATDVRTDWVQKVVELPHRPRGCHVITSELVGQIPELSKFRVGTANFFVLHTSCSLTINENASPDVPLDLNDTLDRIVPEGNHYRHLDEGLDDMPAHVKSSMMGCSLTVPVSQGRLLLGVWQGLYLNEHRDYGGPRRICVTINGLRQE